MFGFNLTRYHYSQKKYEQFTYGTLCFKIHVSTFKINVEIFMFDSLTFNIQFKIQFLKTKWEKFFVFHKITLQK